MQFERRELEEMVQRWEAASKRAEAAGRWAEHLAGFYAEDARCRVCIGADEVYEAHGRDEIAAGLLGEEMQGFEGWTYPFERVVLDDRQGVVSIYWRQVSPFRRSDGTAYAVCGLGNSWFRYGGDFSWVEQEDMFDLGQVTALLMELAAQGLLGPQLKQRLKRMARGHRPAGYARQVHARSPLDKARGYLALGRIALLGG
jgi:hypothetical protein